jgi:hypothetical protein
VERRRPRARKNTLFSTVKTGRVGETFISIARTSSSILARPCSTSGTTMHDALAGNAARKSSSPAGEVRSDCV